MRKRLDALFAEADRPEAERLLVEECGRNLPFCEKSRPKDLERIRFAALKLSEGGLDALIDAVRLAKEDWRDLLVASGFAHNVTAHRAWMPESEAS